jgi:hypothetical protein
VCRKHNALQELVDALNGLHTQRLTFCERYAVRGAHARRMGGQGLVQFANILLSREERSKVRRPWPPL